MRDRRGVRHDAPAPAAVEGTCLALASRTGRSRTVALALALGLAVPLAGPTARRRSDAAVPAGPARPGTAPRLGDRTVAGAADQRLIVRFRAGHDARWRAAPRPPHPGRRRASRTCPASGIAVVRATGGDAAADDRRRSSADPRRPRRQRRRTATTATSTRRPSRTGTSCGASTTPASGSTRASPARRGRANVDIDGLPGARGHDQGDPSVVVAVIDDGVDFSHPDLAAQAWTNPGESGGGKETNGVDDDGNGYIDDVHGWDFCHDDNTVHDFDDDFHGTHVAGHDRGVARRRRESSASRRASGSWPSSSSRTTRLRVRLAGHRGHRLREVVRRPDRQRLVGRRGRNPAAFPALKSAIADSGMLFVASAGQRRASTTTHEPFPAVPASYDLPNILSVAAVDNDGCIAVFSNYGKKTVDIAAPGAAILSSLPDGPVASEPGWGWLDGTSMAAPHVTGVAALVALGVARARRRPGRPASPAARVGQGRARGRRAGPRPAGSSTRSGRSTSSRRSPRRPTGFGFVAGLDPRQASRPARRVELAGRDRRHDRHRRATGSAVQTERRPWATQVSATTGRSSDRTLDLRDDLRLPRPRPRPRRQLGAVRDGPGRARRRGYQEIDLARDVRGQVEHLEELVVVGRSDALRHDGPARRSRSGSPVGRSRSCRRRARRAAAFKLYVDGDHCRDGRPPSRRRRLACSSRRGRGPRVGGAHGQARRGRDVGPSARRRGRVRW